MDKSLFYADQQSHHNYTLDRRNQHAMPRGGMANTASPRSFNSASRRAPANDSNVGPSPYIGPSYAEEEPTAKPATAERVAEPSSQGIYAYCYDRGNGHYTRLIPADMLPPLVNIPALQQNPDRMVVLPVPQGVPPQGPQSNIYPVALVDTSSSLKSKEEPIQDTIDHICANSPITHKKPKIYCDKWVHEGICAFTQQGCKYKHEMPLDKPTQHSLGLFHGLPLWWKKRQAELQHQHDLHNMTRNESLNISGRERAMTTPTHVQYIWPRHEPPKRAFHKGHRQPREVMDGGPSATYTYRSGLDAMPQYHAHSHTDSLVWGRTNRPSKQAVSGSTYEPRQDIFGVIGTPNNFASSNSLEEAMGNEQDENFGYGGARLD